MNPHLLGVGSKVKVKVSKFTLASKDAQNDIVDNEKDGSTLSDDQLDKLLYDAAADDDAEQVKSHCQQGAKSNRKGHSRYKPV